MKTICMINGSTEYNGVSYVSHTTQNKFECADDEAQRLVDSGFAEFCEPLEKPPVSIFPENSEKIRSKIAELKKRLGEAEGERESLLNDNLEDLPGVTKKIDGVNSRINSFNDLLCRQREKLARAEKADALEAERATVKKLEETTHQNEEDTRKILTGVSDAISMLLQNLDNLSDLYNTVDKNFMAAGGGRRESPLLSALILPGGFDRQSFANIQSAVKTNLDRLASAADRTPEKLAHILNAKHFKSRNELEVELREYYRKKSQEPETIKIEARTQDWKIEDDEKRIGDKPGLSAYMREIQRY